MAALSAQHAILSRKPQCGGSGRGLQLPEIEHVSGHPLNRLNVAYNGEDPKLADREHLTLNEIKPVLKEWGY
jgi:hypothetical protein